jgi:hypothetical protein
MTIRKFGGLLAAAAVLLLGACTEGITNPGDGQLSAIRVTANTSGTPINTLVVTVTAADIPTPLVFNIVASNGVATGTIKVPPGAARTFTVRAYDTGGSITHEGSATIDVVPGNNNPTLTISLGPRSGHVPIEVTFGAASVIVSPAADSVFDDSTLQLAATVINAQGDTITATVDWATSNPAKATVDANGLVTAVDTGTVEIHATYEGIGGFATLTIVLPDTTTPPPPSGSFVWTGAVSTDWHTAGNWNVNAVPGAADSVTIPSAPANQPLLGAAASVGRIDVQSGATLTLAADLTVSTDVVANGVIDGAAFRVNMTGTGTVVGTLPRLRVTGIVSLAGNTSTRQIQVDGGRITDAAFALAATS